MNLTAIFAALVAAAVAWFAASRILGRRTEPTRSPAPRPTPSEGLPAAAAATAAAAEPKAQAAAAVSTSDVSRAVVVLADDLRAQADIVAGMIGASKPPEPPK